MNTVYEKGVCVYNTVGFRQFLYSYLKHKEPAMKSLAYRRWINWQSDVSRVDYHLALNMAQRSFEDIEMMLGELDEEGLITMCVHLHQALLTYTDYERTQC